ncbi:MAG TPA: tetratricopeptide repeat protein [Anaerolineales bacterium]|nr:tetratricopeptide repeat protein [Anaerolineales bacterium]
MSSHLPSGTVTFLFTDIEGSTHWWEEHPEWMAQAFARQEAILRAAAEAHGGYVYKMIGDAFQVAFDTALDALHAAIEAQRALNSEPWGEIGPLRVRMALHTGVTEERNDDYVGPVLNRLGRLLSVSQGGQILLSQATYELVRDFLPHQTQLYDLGTHRLKDLIRPEHIYQVTAPGLPADFSELKTLDLFPHNLPMQLTSFVGREKEIVEVKRQLLGDRLVTLTGPGGTGKTRLALQVGAELLELFPDGVWLVELASLSDPALVPQSVASVLGIREAAGRPILTVLTDYLRSRELLLILDNCEHLLAACAQLVATLLQACPHNCILATSREALNIPGEFSFRVPSLSIPDIHHLPSLPALSQYEAMRLFVERAEIIQPGFELTEMNAPAIAQICRRLDGIPLAIELSVARVKIMPVEQVAARLDDRFRLLTGGSRTALPRHQTLRALIDWSYDLLSETERTLFRRLSVFAGGWTLEAAEAICAGDGLEAGDILDLLTQLVNKSLAIPDTGSDAQARYRLLETIRQYARERLLEAGGGEGVRGRHLEHYLKFAERAEPELRGPDQVAWLDRLEKEIDNIRAALEWALEANIEAGLRIASALLWFWHIRGGKSEGIEWLERALSADKQENTASSSTVIRGKALNAAGTLMIMHGNADRARQISEESLALHQKLGSPGKRGVAYALWNLAQGASYHEDLEQARDLTEKSLALFREVGDKFGVAQCLDHLGSYSLIKGDFVQAKKIWEEDLALRRELGDKDGVAWSLSLLGNLALWQGDYEQAMTLYTGSQEAFREIGNKWAVSTALSGMGSVMLAQGQFEQAAKLYEEALAFGRDMGDQNTIAVRRYDMARVAWSRGDYEQAAKMYEETLTIVRKLDNKGAIAGTLYDLGSVAWVQGNLELAAQRFEESLSLGHEIEGQFTVGYSLNGLGRVAYSQGDYDRARSLYTQSLKRFRESANHWNLAYSLETFAALAVAQGEMQRAARLYGATETFYAQFRFLISPLERENHERNIAAVRAALGEEALSALWEEGRAMTVEQAVEYALKEPHD